MDKLMHKIQVTDTNVLTHQLEFPGYSMRRF